MSDPRVQLAVFRRLLEGTSASVIVLRLTEDGEDAVVELIDPGTAAVLGADVDEVLGARLNDAYPRRNAQEILAHLWIARDHGAATYEAVRDLPTGRRTGRVQLRRVDQDRYLVFSEDISGEREAQRRLRQMERVAQVGTYHWNVSSDEVIWSDELHRIFGYEPGEFDVTLDGFLEHVHPEDRAEQVRLTELAREQGATVTTMFRCVRRDGEQRIVEVRAEAVSADEGQLQYVIGTMQDVTDRRRLERRAEDLRRADARRRTGLEVHDRIVQGLSTAWLALELGDIDRALQAVQETTGNAQQVVQGLLADMASGDGIHPGDLVSGSSDDGATEPEVPR